jgi:hypothetical protein
MSTATVCKKCNKIVLKECVQKWGCKNLKEAKLHDVVKHTHSVWFPGRPRLGKES